MNVLLIVLQIIPQSLKTTYTYIQFSKIFLKFNRRVVESKIIVRYFVLIVLAIQYIIIASYLQACIYILTIKHTYDIFVMLP